MTFTFINNGIQFFETKRETISILLVTPHFSVVDLDDLLTHTLTTWMTHIKIRNIVMYKICYDV